MQLLGRVFSRDVVLGGGEIAFVGRENVKNILKSNEICYCLGGKFKTWGKFPPLKALKKTLLVGKLIWSSEV